MRLLCVFRFDVYRADSGLQETDFRRVPRRLDDHGLILDGDHFSDDSANGGDLIPNLQIVPHGGSFLLLFLLRFVEEEIEKDTAQCQRNHQGQDTGQRIRGFRSRLCRCGNCPGGARRRSPP